MTPEDEPREPVPGDAPPEPAAPAGWLSGERLRAELGRLERLINPGLQILDDAQERLLLPAWRRLTEGEPRWPVSLAIVGALVLQVVLPDRVAAHPRWLLPVLEACLLLGLIAANPRRINKESPRLRSASIVLIAVMSGTNAWSAIKLIRGLLRGTIASNAGPLLATGAAIWLTNVIVFALWYWELDRGGPVTRSHGDQPHPDFLFPQMQSPELAPPDWEAGFADYLYLSFTNATAFSPTDVLPLSRWAKLTMMLQSAVSLSTVALVIARAVNILK